ncbi:MAG: acyl carrier protein [Myxococcales bacterium]|nr:acyl carrier protein [Myxococcales bacterium]
MTLEDRIRAYITESGGLASPPADDDRLVDHGFVPSVQMLDLVGFLEDELKITLRPVDLVPENLATIAAISGMVRDRLASRR